MRLSNPADLLIRLANLQRNFQQNHVDIQRLWRRVSQTPQAFIGIPSASNGLINVGSTPAPECWLCPDEAVQYRVDISGFTGSISDCDCTVFNGAFTFDCNDFLGSTPTNDPFQKVLEGDGCSEISVVNFGVGTGVDPLKLNFYVSVANGNDTAIQWLLDQADCLEVSESHVLPLDYTSGASCSSPPATVLVTRIA